MRLVSAHIKGLGRLADTTVNLDSKLIAFVGPNEAGKTTFLRALKCLEEGEAIPALERSRGGDVKDSTIIVSVKYILDDDDRQALIDLDLEEPPESLTYSRQAGGALRTKITPQPKKSTIQLKQAIDFMFRQMRRTSRSSNSGLNPKLDDPIIAVDLKSLLQEIQNFVKDDLAANPEIEDWTSRADHVLGVLRKAEGDEARHILIDPIEYVIAWLRRDSPTEACKKLLWNRSPDFLLFEDADRSLKSTYTIDGDSIKSPPAALVNFLRMAGLSLADLSSCIQRGDLAMRETLIAKANTKLADQFTSSWRQSDIAARILVEGSTLRLLIWENGSLITIFDERSAGLKMFIALMGFLADRDQGRPIVLLIDEAESHLHIDAQADLVNMFMRQDQAVKVIYTTHSPACLPPDLGVGIRSVVPKPGTNHVSEIRNSFWHSGPGYSPLLLAMGAAAAAFTPARYVLLAEGATEMILLPSLLRAATGSQDLQFQVAPGLSEVPKDFYPNLDLEGSKVAYLVDGDDGGRSLNAALQKSGVPACKIVTLSAPGIENTLPADVYRESVSSLLRECNPGETIPELPVLGAALDDAWSKSLERWAAEQNLKMPSKVAVANWLVQNQKAIVSEDFIPLLKKLHDEIDAALKS